MSGKRVLVTGVSSYWGGRLAQALECDPTVETIIGVDSNDPTRPLERTEFVRLDNQHSLIRRIVHAARIDTVVDTRFTADSRTMSPRVMHENNVLGTMNILAACGGPSSSVRRFIFKSSAHVYGCGQDDPAFFTEQMPPSRAPASPVERDVIEAENAVEQFALTHEAISVTVLRFCNVLGPDVQTSHTRYFGLPVVPTVLGFDPRAQFIHEDDVVGCLEHVVRNDLPGVYNCGGDGVLPLSEILRLLGKRSAPVLPPWGTGLAFGSLRRIGLRFPTEMVQQVRFGRGVDNRRLKATGYRYGFTTRETVTSFREHLQLSRVRAGRREPFRYEREVDEFLRWSPSVVGRERPESAPEIAPRARDQAARPRNSAFR